MEELHTYLKALYKKDAKQLEQEIKKAYTKTQKIEKVAPDIHWYKFANLYFIYPDSIVSRNNTPLRNLIDHVAYVQQLGCNAMHILPFLDSPLIDKGFDIRDFYKVREDLGTIQDIIDLKKTAEKHGVHLFMDLVFNHVSNEHEWFQKAEAGDEKYRNYFIHSKTKPKFIRKFHKESAVWAEYEVNNEMKEVNIAFPEYIGEIPHWVEGKDGYWYYHTYYPDQIDVNWKNPDVFLEFTKILMYWASLGFNFRLDAIPFVGKSAYKEVDNYNEKTHIITAAFNYIAGAINPECAFIVETYESLNRVIDYFGTSNLRQAQLAYNFHLCTYLWVSLIKQDIKYIWEKLDTLYKIPTHAEWLNFLRNHDELSLAYLPNDLLQEVQNALLKNGEPFREGYGIAGRTFSLLSTNEQRFLMAYFLLASLPGGMVIPYGDELGQKNIPLVTLSELERKDTRNMNRGQLTKTTIQSPKGKRLYKIFAELLQKRQVFREYLNIWPEKISDHKNIFGVVYRVGTSELIVLINISEKKHKVTLHKKPYKKVYKISSVRVVNNEVFLGPYAGIWLQR